MFCPDFNRTAIDRDPAAVGVYCKFLASADGDYDNRLAWTAAGFLDMRRIIPWYGLPF